MSPQVKYDVIDFNQRFEDSLRSGYIDSSVEGDSHLMPKFVANDRRAATNLLSVIKQQLKNCTQFDFSVAFVADGGLQTLLETLNELRDKGISGRFLTSTYLNFNSPNALRKLAEFDNIEVRVFEGNMHTKGYFFDKGHYSTVIIGSSNLTQTALTCNQEWNVLFHSYNNGGMLESASEEFEYLWNNESTVAITDEWIERYTAHRKLEKPAQSVNKNPFRSHTKVEHTESAPSTKIKPNKMQKHALEALAVLHARNEQRALLVSATGTGKTYLSALDVAAAKPTKVLFIAHRKRILEASRQSFETVLGNNYTYADYGAGSLKPRESCVFAMVSTLTRHLNEFDPAEFDYIIIDEAHRTGANSYQAIMNHFTPKFYLGMTATPSRTDGYDVFGLFNHVIAYRITLQDALDNEMLTPFHYFGIADLEIDDQETDNYKLFNKLTSSERVRHIAEKIEQYSIDKEARRGLIFCSRNDEARKLSAAFNDLGYRTAVLSGSDSDASRNETIAKLESGELEYIFSVDILNEGVDIPSLNQIIMLRKTESAIVFIQQLGRGLRLADNKEYTLVLDFIGNYQTNYFIPIALSGDRTYNKDNLRVFVKEGSTIIPGCSTVNFDRISESRIFRALDDSKFGTTKLIREEYENLKMVLGHMPRLLEFDENESIDPLLIIGKFKSYHNFLAKYEPSYKVSFTNKQEKILEFVSLKSANGKRISDLIMLKTLIERTAASFADVSAAFRGTTGRALCENTAKSSLSFLAGNFAANEELLVGEGDDVRLSAAFAHALNDAEFKRQVLEVIEFGIARAKRLYNNTYKETSLVLYAKYTYEEVCKLLNWEKNINGQNIGGYKYDAVTNTFPVFINYDKDPSISDTIKYEDRFVSDSELIAISKQPRYIDSPEIERLRQWPENGMRSYLFVRKNKDDKDGGKEFYFLGEIYPTGKFKPITMPGTTKSAVEITYRLDRPVRADLYDYLTGDLGEEG